MRQFHEYYMAQATEMDGFGFEFIILSPHVFHYPEEEKFDVEWECVDRISSAILRGVSHEGRLIDRGFLV